MSNELRVTVPLGDRTYDVLVGNGAVRNVATLVPAGVRRVALVTQAGNPIAARVEPGVEFEIFEIPNGEHGKSLQTIEDLCRGFVRFGMTRSDCVIGVGGGLVTDVAGFAASVYHRGIAVVHVATSLLAMVDAAIGGKTGVNLPEGKNLVGAFWQPSGVVCDLDALDTLPEREVRCGLGEMAKYHFLTGDDLRALPVNERVARCVAIKAEVVGSDERESGRRAILNYGHTLAHALETATDHALAHGEAVAVGLGYAARLARVLGRIGSDRVNEHDRVIVDAYGLTNSLPVGVDHAQLVDLMGRDKKVVNGLTFVLDGPDGVETVADVPVDAVREALSEMPTDGGHGSIRP
jgi:5-deoxy-5-amino-3-dehydroquinate synthase